MAMTVDELARKSGLTVRNIRSYQTRGLLPLPQRQGRAATYGEEHLERLAAISELQSRGYSLAAIGELLEARERGEGLHGLLDAFARADRDSGRSLPSRHAEPAEITHAQLAEEFEALATNPALMARAIGLGVLEPSSTGYVVPSPALLGAGARMAGAGISIEALFDALEQLQLAIRRALKIIADDFRASVWDPQSTGVQDRAELDEAISVLGELPAITRDAVDAAMVHEIQRAPLIRLLTEPDREGGV